MQRIEELYQKYLDDTILDTERQELFQLLRDADNASLEVLANSYLEKDVPSDLAYLQEDTDRVLAHIRPLIGTPEAIADNKDSSRGITRLIRWAGVAAAVLLFGIIIHQLYQLNRSQSPDADMAYAEDVAPGGNKATLKLSDGTTYQLAEDKEELQANKSFYTYEDGKQLGAASSTVTSATLVTPRGGQYRIVLPDGSRVVLNASSSLAYPIHFEGSRRSVQLEGEAYFEVAKDRTKPFIVKSHRQEITVTGTEFNINSYNDESSAMTTLIEGQVRIKDLNGGHSAVLSPGQQAVSGTKGFTVQTVNSDSFIAWKDNYFVFDGLPLATIFRQLERWYDIEVDYNQIPDETFSARIRRDKNISVVLHAIAKTSGIDFYIKERRIMVKQ